MLFEAPGDGPIYVRDDYLVIPAPKVDCAMAATGSLILSGHTEHHIVGSFLQLQIFLKTHRSAAVLLCNPQEYVHFSKIKKMSSWRKFNPSIHTSCSEVSRRVFL